MCRIVSPGAASVPLLLALVVAGCEGDGVVNIPDDGIDTETFLVEYRAESTFPSCAIDYRGDDGELISLENQTMPFAASINAEVEGDDTFEAVITADCGGTQFVGNATVRISVDGSLRASESATGTSFTVTAATTLRRN